jgi:pectate lyase
MVPAFPGAEGDGRYASGGRGGQVVHVTNLNAEGPGSLADAVSEGNRIVVFDVSGIIDITKGKKDKLKGGSLKLDHPNLTIAAQTAPGEGICIKGGDISISASNIILRYVRSRRGWITEGDSGDAITVKPVAVGEATEAEQVPGRTKENFEKTFKKKLERGKQVSIYADINDIIIDHCSTSWATDENLTMTHAGRATMGWCIAAEGCDYANPKQTPPNHSEGSLWGSSAPDGRSTLHHTLYAHNRLRNPRTVGGSEVPPVLTFYNNVVYDWSEYPTHTGSETVHLLWLNSFYKPGPCTPEEIRGSAFQFHSTPDAKVYVSGNVIDGREAETQDNKRAVGWEPKKFKQVSEQDRQAMIVATPWIALPAMQSARDAYASVLNEAGATLPARDAVDLRITRAVHDGAGQVIEKETSLPENQRWPDYRSLPSLADEDHDGLPDEWQKSFGVRDAAAISHGYANIEHWFNNTDPTGKNTPVVFVSATVSRATPVQAGEWRISRTGDLTQPLDVVCDLSGDAVSGRDFAALPVRVTIPAGEASTTLALPVLPSAKDDVTAVITLRAPHVGCPSRSLIVIRR